MTIFNRVFMLLLGLLIFAFGAITFLLLTGIVVPQNTYLRYILALYTAFRAIMLLRGATTNIAVIVALIISVIGLALVFLELLPMGRAMFGQRKAKQYVVKENSLGRVTLDRSMVADLAQHVAEATPGVAHATAEVKDVADGLHITTHIALAWDADAPALGLLLQEKIKNAVQTQLGLLVTEVLVIAQPVPVVKNSHRRVARVA